MDTMVEKTQKWLNANYAQYGTDRFPEVVEDGETGWGTINGLIRALQIELGIQETADNFGAGTIARFNQQYQSRQIRIKANQMFTVLSKAVSGVKAIVPDQVKSPSIFILEPDQG